jgi:Ca2+:H+ antiporter
MARRQLFRRGAALRATAAAGATAVTGTSAPILAFCTATLALVLLAGVVGEATDALSTRLSPAATGIVQSAIGNAPELFVCFFALKAGLVTVVQTAVVGSILANSLLVLGLAFTAGGIRHGRQVFDPRTPRTLATLNLLAVAALVVPTATAVLHTPAEGREGTLSAACAVVLLVIFLASLPFSLSTSVAPARPAEEGWSMLLTLSVLVGAGLGAALASDWFIDALAPAMASLGISEAFAGLVIVALAGNAVENLVGVRLALDNRMEYAVSLILNSSLQVALAVIPILVLASLMIAPTPLTLVMPPLLVTALFLSALLGTVVAIDGESNWLEGLVLIGLYGIVVTAFWWG